ncbi:MULTISPECIES: MarR family winged helix-turn-helix transcriptional regulator [Bacteria]
MPTPPSPVRDLDSEPQRYVGYLIRRAQQRHVALWSTLVSTETSSVQYSILAVLDRLTEASQKELCDEVDLDRSTVADLVARMERRGLIERRRDSRDSRRNVVSLSASGVAEHARLEPLVESVQIELTRNLTDEDRDGLVRILRLMLR